MGMKPRYTSNAGIFAKRGDPWVTNREGVRDFGRNPDDENPDYDFDYRFHETGNVLSNKPKIAQARPEYRDPRPAPKTDDPERRKANILRRMNTAISGHSHATAVADSPRQFRACPGCRASACVKANACLRLNR